MCVYYYIEDVTMWTRIKKTDIFSIIFWMLNVYGWSVSNNDQVKSGHWKTITTHPLQIVYIFNFVCMIREVKLALHPSVENDEQIKFEIEQSFLFDFLVEWKISKFISFIVHCLSFMILTIALRLDRGVCSFFQNKNYFDNDSICEPNSFGFRNSESKEKWQKFFFIVHSALCLCQSFFFQKWAHFSGDELQKKPIEIGKGDTTKQNRQRKAIEKSLLNKLSFEEISVEKVLSET